jgi:NAD(P)H-hydrate epimerase
VNVCTVLTAPSDKSQGDAGTNLMILQKMTVGLVSAHEPDGLDAARDAIQAADVIVDALLGTGSKGAPRGVMATLVELANAAPRARRIAIDIPSGLDAETGAVHEPCFKADATVTMVAPKTGFLEPAARSVVGRIVTVDIGTPRALIPGRKDPFPGLDS